VSEVRIELVAEVRLVLAIGPRSSKTTIVTMGLDATDV
jgi:hypothetical protein